MLTAGASAIRNRNYDICSRWAVARRTMQDGSQYSLEHYPYVEGILNSRAKKNWIMKAAQVGLTEAGITIAMFEADFHGRDVIYYFPTKRMGERFSKTRFSPAIQLSDYLKQRCTNNSVEIKQFGTSTIHILGANSMADLKGTSSGRLLFDELDEWTEQQIYLAEERASGQKNDDTIIWGFSTPKFPNLGVHKQFLSSTQEHFFFDCPHCHDRIELLWEERGGGDFGSKNPTRS
jgi:phage terminase large subunit GpA-like protein